MPRVFISHSSSQADLGGRIADALEAAGIEAWISTRNIRLGTFYDDELTKALVESDVVLYLASADAAQSVHCRSELEIAASEGLTIVPVRIDLSEEADGLRFFIGRRQAFTATGEQSTWVPRLVRELGVLLTESAPLSERDKEELPSEPPSTANGDREDRYRSFWTRYLGRLRTEHPDWTRSRVPSSTNWMSVNGPVKGTRFIPLFRSGGQIGHDLYIDTGDKATSESMFDELHRAKEGFELAYGGPLDWQRLDGKRACRIADHATGSIRNTAEYDQYIDWFFTAGTAMRHAIAEHLESLRRF